MYHAILYGCTAPVPEGLKRVLESIRLYECFQGALLHCSLRQQSCMMHVQPLEISIAAILPNVLTNLNLLD